MRELKSILVFGLMALIAGCGGGTSGEIGSDGPRFESLAIFDPVPINAADSASIPFPFDGLFAGFTAPTLNIPNADNVSFVTAANQQDGYSTTASIFCDVLGFIDFSTLSNGLFVFNSATGQRLTPGVDYAVQSSPALAEVPGSNPPVEAPINRQRSRILIEPLKPLTPSTRYLVALTTAVRNSDGRGVIPSATFKIVRSGTPVAQQDDPYLQYFDDGQLATLEALRQQSIRPVVQGVMQLASLPESDIVLAWSFTTQSIRNSLDAIEQQATAEIAANPGARSMVLVDTGFDLAQAGPHDAGGIPLLPPIAEVYAGQIALPYFLQTSGGNPHSTAPLTGFWHADPTQPDLGKSFLGQVPCGAFVQPPPGTNFHPSVSTTLCFPVPVKTADVVVPVLMTVPNANSGHTMPESGWPVVVFQHGITGNRSQMLALAPALSLAGFAVVAIDLPLHGITPEDSAAILRNPATPERSFDLDLASNTTGAPGPDGVVDGSGTWFINLASLLTSRDNLRQAESDLIYLTKSVPAALVLSAQGAPAGITLDGNKRRFVGHSLGGIVGSTFLGVNGDIGAATLAMPGGGVAKLLDASRTFGPIVAAGLAGNGVHEGTDDSETFNRFAQTLVDSGDPINYAGAAATAHPIHMIEVINDTVVPNNALANAGSASFDRVLISGFLSGTDPLFEQMGLDVRGPLDVPVASASVLLGPAARNVVVQFNQGDHGSILSPAASAAATFEMQRQTANFLASDGLCLPIGGSCPQ
jgi:dienelactone hydrolase